MVNLNHIEEQLKRVGCNFRFWGRPEIRELANILVPGEVIAQCVNGTYEGGYALLCATNHRLLLVDKKPLFLTVEDIRFDMIAEIDYSSRLLNGSIRLITANRTLSFTSWGQDRLRKIVNYTQQRVTEIRQHYMVQQFQPQQQSRETMAASLAGGLAIHMNNNGLPMNPYTHVPLLTRQRRVPKFY